MDRSELNFPSGCYFSYQLISILEILSRCTPDYVFLILSSSP